MNSCTNDQNTVNKFSAEYKLAAIPFVFSRHGIVFSKSDAAKLVGGRGILERLVEAGIIRAEKPSDTQNGKWFCDGGDVLRNIKY